MGKITDALLNYQLVNGIDFNQLLIKGLFAIIIVVLGVILGRLISLGLKKLTKKIELNQKMRGSFIDLIIGVIRWSVYIIFLNLALNELGIPALTNVFTKALIVVPAITGALFILVIGFVIAVYLREVIEDVEMNGWQILSKLIFYFIIYVFAVYALKTALISFDSSTTNLIVLILTLVIGSAGAYVIAKKEIKRVNS